MLALSVYLMTLLSSRARTDERGQASAEYALVLLGAAAIALLIVAWATKTDLIEKLLDTVVKSITGKAK
jgi:Flp pilus assembly pilin Flp